MSFVFVVVRCICALERETYESGIKGRRRVKVMIQRLLLDSVAISDVAVFVVCVEDSWIHLFLFTFLVFSVIFRAVGKSSRRHCM